MAVRIEQQDAFAWGPNLPQTTVELEEDILLHFFRLVNHEEPEVIVLKLLGVV